MQLRDIHIATEKGHQLAATFFCGSQTNNKTLVISSATGVLQGYYKKFALYFASLGYTVYSFDYYGIGKSGSDLKSLKENPYDLKSWGSNDQAAVVTYAKERHPDNELILLTHSVGGQVLGFNPKYTNIDKIIMVASQSGFWRYFKGWHYPKMWLFWNLMIPMLTPIFGYFPAKKIGLFENLPKYMVYQWARWGRKTDYMMHYHNERDYYFKNVNVPLLSMSFPRDHFAPKAATDWLTGQYTSAKITRFHYPKEGPQPFHFGFFREQFKDPLWAMTHKWICDN